MRLSSKAHFVSGRAIYVFILAAGFFFALPTIVSFPTFCQTRLGASAGLDNRPLCFQSRCLEADRHNSVWWWNCFSPFSRSSETPLLSTFCSHHAKTVILLIFGPFPLRPAQRIRQSGSHDEVEVLLPHVLPKYPSTLICWHPCLFFVVIIKQFLCRKPGALIIMHRVKGIGFFQPPCGFCFRNFYGSWRSRWPIVRGKRLVWGQTQETSLCGGSDRFYFTVQISKFTSHYTERVQFSNRGAPRPCSEPLPGRLPFVCRLFVLFCRSFFLTALSSITGSNNVKSLF